MIDRITPVAFSLLLVLSCVAHGWGGEAVRISVTSSMDQSPQPSYLVLPHGHGNDASLRPLLVSLHSWSADLEQRNSDLETLADERGWICLFPNFRGRNDHPEACGSVLAQQDIIDAIQWTRERYPVDPKRIYLTGNSGGGHMTMLMVGRFPDVWAAASAWVGISDLAAWYQGHDQTNYGIMMRKVCGGSPGESPEIDREYRDRSPLSHLHHAANVPLEISAGVNDGHSGSVPIRQSLWAFNTLARANATEVISDEEIEQISRPNGRLESPKASDRVEDASYGRAIHLRRHTSSARVTIFEGGHEGIAAAAIAWLERHARSD